MHKEVTNYELIKEFMVEILFEINNDSFAIKMNEHKGLTIGRKISL